jgi:ribonuclease Z
LETTIYPSAGFIENARSISEVIAGMNRIVFTGTASGFPSPDRACSSFVLQLGDKLYQFDAGEGFSNSVQRLKINFNQITQVFISHLHPDHITGIFLELQLMYLAGRRMPLEIYVPDEGVESLEKAARLFYLFKENSLSYFTCSDKA